MKKKATTRIPNRRSVRERKNPNSAQNQLSKRRSKAASRKSKEHPNMGITLEQPISEETETAVPEAPKATPAEFSRGQLGKARRAFAKAGHPDVSEEARTKWLAEMSQANVAVMDFTSSRLAKVIKGELTVEELRRQAKLE